MPELDPEVCYRALLARDERFDGRLFVGVTSTGIYCRPVCPARPAKLQHCRFYRSAAGAQEAGFRPCLRCRPETAPALGPILGSWRGTSNTVSRGLALIAEGELDGAQATVEALATRLGVGERQLRRLFQQHVGASPVSVAQTRRVLFAKQLIHETRLPLIEIALASGFGSVRRFNEAFSSSVGCPPSALRRGSASTEPFTTNGVNLRLRTREPYDWPRLLEHFRVRAVRGVERVENGTYRRVVEDSGRFGSVLVTYRAPSLSVDVRFPDVRALPRIVARIRNAFDIGADVEAIGEHLSRDPLLATLVAARPGLRAPGAFSEFELAARAVLGQQVSLEAARKLADQLVLSCGRPLSSNAGMHADLTHAFPSPKDILDADLRALRMPNARRRALVTLAQAASDDSSLFRPSGAVEETVLRLKTLPGIGEWTAHYIALRAVREPDAFPASDAGLLRAAERLGIEGSLALLGRAERWRPFRAYAAQHLWALDGSIGEPRATVPRRKAS